MASNGDKQYFTELGFSAYFSKPVTGSDIIDSIALIMYPPQDSDVEHPIVTHQYLSSLIPQDGRAADNLPIDNNESSLQHKSTIDVDLKQSAVSNLDRVKKSTTNILLVEDNKTNIMVATLMLEEIGHNVTVANDGQQALASLASASNEAPFTIVLMDCQMPIMDGYQATQAIRSGTAGERYITIPIIAMTANAMIGDDTKCFDAGMSDYLTKPLDMDALTITLKKWQQYSTQTITDSVNV